MRGLTLRLLSAAAVLSLVLSWIADLISSRAHGPLLVLPLSSGAGLLLLAGVLLVLGLRVRRLRDGDRGSTLDRSWGPLTAALAQAVALLGAASLGWHALLSLGQLMLVPLRTDQGPLWLCLFQSAVGAVLVVIGWIVERFCRIPPEDPEADAVAERGPGPAQEGGLARWRD